jgi:hypothetical protein
MGMYDSPEPPAAPDYAAATRAGVEANAELMPLLIAVDRAARMGTSYTDPQTGKVYDFSGLGGDRALIDMDIDAQKRLLEAGAGISRQLERDRLNDSLELLPRYNELNLDAQKRAMEESLRLSGDFTRNQYEQDLAFRPRFGELQRSEDAKTFDQNLRLGELGTRRFADLQNELLPAANRAGLAAQTEAEQARLDAFRTTDPTRWNLRQRMLEDADRELAAGATLTADQLERLQQNVRGAQAARGNILGAGAGYDEGRLAQEAGDRLQQQRRQNALQVLQAGELGPRFTAAQVVNPLMPNYQSAPGVNPAVPNMQATTTGGPNLSPAGIQRSNPLEYMNPSMGAQGADYARSVWQTQAQIKSQEMNPWMAGLSLGFKGLSVLKPGGF